MVVAPTWLDLSPEALAKLVDYVALLLKWNDKINLVSRETIPDIWDRHIWDCAQLITLLPKNLQRLADLGSGAGLPGIVLAIALPETALVLVERDQRKSAFLLEAARLLRLPNVQVTNADIATITDRFPAVTARALASLETLCGQAHRIMQPDAICLFPKGEKFATEIEEAQQHWSFDHKLIASKTNHKAMIIALSQLKAR